MSRRGYTVSRNLGRFTNNEALAEAGHIAQRLEENAAKKRYRTGKTPLELKRRKPWRPTITEE